MALSQYDIAFLNDAEEALIKQYTNEWERAKAAGDTAAMAKAHDKAEAVRAKYDYSGGGWGNQYIAIATQNFEQHYEAATRNAQIVDPYYTKNQGTSDTPNGTFTSTAVAGLVDIPAGVTRFALYGGFALAGLLVLKMFTKK